MSRSSGKCSGCSCHWRDHVNSKYVYETVAVTEKVTNETLKQRYDNTNSSKSAAEQILDGITAEINDYQINSLEIHMHIQQSMKQLEKLALTVNVYDTANYYDQLIKCEEAKHQSADTIKKI